MSKPENSSMSLQAIYEGGLRVTQGICAIATAPIEYALRPHFSTCYFDPIQMMLTCILMMMLPLLGRVTEYLPFESDGASGFVGLGTFSALFFAASFIHGPRLWRRTFNMDLENHSKFEGEALPFFAYLPLGTNFWVVRVIWEPVFVAGVAVTLSIVPILTRPAMIYLFVCAGLLAAKNYLSWYQSWLYIRGLMDARFVAPLAAKAAAGKATEKELATVHMAGFVGSVPEQIRAVAIAQIAPPAPALPPEIAQLVSAVEPADKLAA